MTEGDSRSVIVDAPSDVPDKPTADQGAKVVLMMIDTALQIMLQELDISKNLVDIGSTRKISDDFGHIKRYEKLLSPSDRRMVERAVDDYVRRTKENPLGDGDGAKPAAAGTEHKELDKLYPPATEMLIASALTHFTEANRPLLAAAFAPLDDDPIKWSYAGALIRVGQPEVVMSTLIRALLPVQIRSFVTYVSSLVRIGLFIENNGLGDLPPIPGAIYEKYGQNTDSRDITRWMIDRKIEDVLRSGDPNVWVASVAAWTQLPIGELGGNWAVIGEAFQRERIYINNGGLVDEEYLRAAPTEVSADQRLGLSVFSDRSYFDTLTVELETIACCLAAAWPKRFARQANPDAGLFIDRIVELERAKRWSHALAIADAVLRWDLRDQDDLETVQVNQWFCLQQVGREDGTTRRQIEAWSPSENYIAIAKPALLYDYDALHSGIRKMLSNTRKPYQLRRELRDMPLIQRAMSESPQIKQAVADHGGPIRRKPGRR